METEQLVYELEENIEEFDDHEQEFIESVCNYYHTNGFVTEGQKEWLQHYYNKLQEMYE